MKLVCGECGGEIPEGMDFCPRCGCKADRAYAVQDGNPAQRVCPSCGKKCSDSDLFCGNCGAQIPAPVYRAPSIDRRGTIAIFLGLIPGFFNVFGIGHLILKQYSRGAMFLCMSLVLWYLNGWNITNQSLFLSIISIGLFIYQGMDLMRAVYTQEGR